MSRTACLAAVLIALVAAAPADAVLTYHRLNQVVAARNDGSHARVVARGSFPVVSPDGRLLIYGTRGRGHAYDELWLLSTRGGRPQLLGHGVPVAPGYPALSPHWSPDSRYVFFSDGNDALSYFYDVRRHRRLTIGFFVTGASFSPDSARAVLQESDPKSSWLVTVPIGGGRGTQLGGGRMPAWGSGGIAYVRNAGLWLKPRIGAVGRLLLRQDGHFPIYPVGWSRDGRRLLVAAGVGAQPALQALIVMPRTRRVTALSPIFTDITAMSSRGIEVLGVLGRNVVATSIDGSVHVLARGADEPSWNK